MATAAVPLGVYTFEWPVVVLAMLGKYIAQVRGIPRVSLSSVSSKSASPFASSPQVCWGIVYLYTNELFPTVIRSVALSFACSMARIGSMAAPFIAYLAEINPILPIFVFGSITFVVSTTSSTSFLWTVASPPPTPPHNAQSQSHLLCPRWVSSRSCCQRLTGRSCLTPWRRGSASSGPTTLSTSACERALLPSILYISYSIISPTPSQGGCGRDPPHRQQHYPPSQYLHNLSRSLHLLLYLLHCVFILFIYQDRGV